MAFWKLGFSAGPTIDSLLSRPSSRSGYHTPSSPTITLDKLLDQDDLLQEVKAQHHKLVEFLGQVQVVKKMLAYVSGSAFQDDDADRPDFIWDDDGPRSRASPDLFSDIMNSEARSTEARAKDEVRKVRFPYLCAEIIAAQLWTVNETIFSHASDILGPFWDDVLNLPVDETLDKVVHLGHWSRVNAYLFNFRPDDMLAFAKTRSLLLEKMIHHLAVSPVADLLLRMVQCESSVEWLADQRLIPQLVDLLSPQCPSDMHVVASDFLRSIINHCSMPVGPDAQTAPPGLSPEISLPESISQPSQERRDRFGSSRLVRDIASEETISRLMAFAFDDTPSSLDISTLSIDNLPNSSTACEFPRLTSATSSLINCILVLLDLIRKNNSDFVEERTVALHFQNLSEQLGTTNEDARVDVQGPSIVPLSSLLVAAASRVHALQTYLKNPSSFAGALQTTNGTIEPLTMERFRICEFYAELMHCSNMRLMNRPRGTGPAYNEEGYLLDASQFPVLEAIVSAVHQSKASTTGEMTTGLHSSNASIIEIPQDPTRPGRGTASTPSSGHEPSVESPFRDGPWFETSATPQTRVQADSNSITSLNRPSSSLDVSVSTIVSEPNSVEAIIQSDPVPGAQLKLAFRQHEVMETCIDLFCRFPWHNFLHTVIYDLILQIFGGNMEDESNLELAKAVIVRAELPRRIVEASAWNDEICSKRGGARLGHMGHLILIAEEVAKMMEAYPQHFTMPSGDIKVAWDVFLQTAVLRARQQTAVPLGGGPPVIPADMGHLSESSENDEEEEPKGGFWGRSRGWADAMPGGGGSHDELGAEGLRGRGGSTSLAAPFAEMDTATTTTAKSGGGEFARYFVSQISSGRGDKFSSSGSEDSDDDDGSGAFSSAWRVARSTGNVTTSSTTPKVFDFDDRFGEARQLDKSPHDEFGDDFGPFTDAAAAKDPFGDDNFAPLSPLASTSSRLLTTTATTKKKSPPAVPPRKNLTPADWNAEFKSSFDQGSISVAAAEKMFGTLEFSDDDESEPPSKEEGEDDDDDDDDFGDFESAPENPSGDGDSDSWETTLDVTKVPSLSPTSPEDAVSTPLPPLLSTSTSPNSASPASRFVVNTPTSPTKSPPSMASRILPQSPMHRRRRSSAASASSKERPLGPGVPEGAKVNERGLLEVERDGKVVVVPMDDVVVNIS